MGDASPQTIAAFKLSVQTKSIANNKRKNIAIIDQVSGWQQTAYLIKSINKPVDTVLQNSPVFQDCGQDILLPPPSPHPSQFGITNSSKFPRIELPKVIEPSQPPSFNPTTLPDFEVEGPVTETLGTQRDVNPNIMTEERNVLSASSTNPIGHFETMNDLPHGQDYILS